MNEPTYRFDVLMGSIHIGQLTGRILRDADGWSYYEQEDTVTYDQFGREVKREVHKPFMRWKDEEPPAPKPFWLRAVSWFKKETMQ